MAICPSCFINKARKHLTLGLLPCKTCIERQNKLMSPDEYIEIIPERIKLERQERGDSIVQPHLKGQLNKKYIDLYGEQAAKERGFSDKEIKNAKYVYDKCPGMGYYGDST